MDALTDVLLFIITTGNVVYGLVTGQVLSVPGVVRKSENDYGFWLLIAFWGVGSLVFLFALVRRAVA